MNNDEGAISFATNIDNRQLAADAARSNALLRGIGNTASTEGTRMGSAFNSASGYIGAMALGAVASIGVIGKTILDTTAKFEKFGIVLKNTLGETKGAEALTMIANFAATTPFQLDEVTGAFIKMANQGFVPTQAEMVKLGDLASSTGKSFDQLGEALLDAQTGQFERLKEFGIKASANGDRVTFSFKEQQTTVQNTNSAIQKYILSLGELKGVAGANAKISESLTGIMSNMGDKLAAMYNGIGKANSGFLYAAVGGVSTLIDNYKLVGDVLTGLIATYGAYRVAIMYIAYTENLAAAAKTKGLAVETAYQAIIAQGNIHMAARARGVAVEILQQEARVAATHQVIAAERELQASSSASKATLANPYVLALMAVVALGYGIYKLATYQTDLEKATSKLNVQVANEKDKAADLFAELNHATKSTDEWKKAKDGILEQYGTYLTEQQKELLGTKNQAEAQDAVNRGIEENISLKIKKESLDAVRGKYNEMITGSVDNLGESAKSSLDRDASAKFNKDLKVQVELIKYEVDPAKKAILLKDYDTLISELKSKVMKDGGVLKGYALTNIEAYASQVKSSLIELSGETVAINNAFAAEGVKSDAKKVDPILTTYQAQLDVIKGKKAKAEQELAKLKSTPGENPMKDIVAKQGEIDEYNKQLGIKESEAKKTEIEQIKKLMETAHGRTLAQLTERLKKLEEIRAIEEDIAGGTKMKGVTDGVNPSDQAKIISEYTSAVQGAVKADVAKNDKEILQANEKMKKANDAYQKDKDHQQWLYDDKLRKETEEKERQAALANGFFDIADAAGNLSKAIGESNQGLSDMLGGIGKIAGTMGNLVNLGAFAKGGSKMSKGDAISMAIGGATDLVGIVISAAAERKRVMTEFYANIISQQQEYNLLLNDQLRINSEIKGTLFLKDYEGSLNDATSAYNEAQSKYKEALTKFSSSEAITGKKNVVDGKNVLGGIGAGAALGAGIGSIVPGIGTVIGAAAGAIIGGLAGLFAKKKKNIVAPLLETYPDLIKANGEFNADLAKTLVTNNQVTEATKQTLNTMIEWKDAADKATAQIKQVITDLTGGLGDDLRTALVAAFTDGTDAAKAFEGSVNKVLENIMSNMIFNKAFEGAFKTLEEAMASSYAVGGDQSWLNDFQAFYAQSPELIDQFNKGMADAKNAASGAGFDIFKGTDTARTASSKGFTTMSQDSADELNGRFTAMQGHTFSINEGVKILTANSAGILKHLAGIESNTGRLEAIENGIGAIKGGIDDINLKGITLRK